MKLLCVLSVTVLAFGTSAAEPNTMRTRARSQATRVVPASIDATGKVDVTDALDRFIDGVGDGDTIRLAHRGRYRIDGTVTLKERNGLTIDGNSSTLFAKTEGDRERSQLSVDLSTNIIIRDLKIVGANPVGGSGETAYQRDLEAQHGVSLESSRQVELDRLTVTDVFGDFVYVGRSARNSPSEDVWIHDSHFARNGRQGVAVTDARNVIIERNEITNTRRSTFDLEPNTQTSSVDNVHILDNQIGPGRLLFVASHGGGPVNGVVIERNVLRGHSMGIEVKSPVSEHRNGFYVADNKSDAPARRTPMRFIRVDSVVVRNNRQHVSRRGEVGVKTKSVCGLAISGNDFGAGTKPTQTIGPPCTERRALTKTPIPSITVGPDRRIAPATTTPSSPGEPGREDSATRKARAPRAADVAQTTAGRGEKAAIAAIAVAFLAVLALGVRRRLKRS